MTQEQKDAYYIKRKRSKIPLRILAEYLNCSIQWISRFEIEDGQRMSEQKMKLYRQYIDQHSK